MVRRAFDFLPLNERETKPRSQGMTEIRGPYYSPMGRRYLADILETAGEWIDSLKFAGGAFTLMPREQVAQLIELAHQHDVNVSTGGFIERILTWNTHELVDRYLEECQALGFDTVELSLGFLSMPPDDLVRLVERVQRAGIKPKPELGIQFGAGGDTPASDLATEGTRGVDTAVTLARRCLDAGADLIMVESEGITENVQEWRTDAISTLADELGPHHLMFEAADPDVFRWYVKNFGPEVNLFVDHSQIVQLEALRSGVWGPHDLFGRVVTYKDG